MWFKKNNDGEVVRSNEAEGNIAIFERMARKTKQYTNDNKLRGKLTWYYGCLHKEATKILKECVRHYHENSNEDGAFWYSHRPRDDKNKPIDELMFWSIIKDRVKRTGLPHEQINFHSLRRGFRSVVRNTSGITENEFKQAIMGHKLRGAEEAYLDKDPLESAREYAKRDFSEPNVEKDRALAEKAKEVERLREQLAKQEEVMEKAKVTTKIEVEPILILESLHVHPTSPELNAAFNEFNDVLEMREQYEKDVKETSKKEKLEAALTNRAKIRRAKKRPNT